MRFLVKPSNPSRLASSSSSWVILPVPSLVIFSTTLAAIFAVTFSISVKSGNKYPRSISSFDDNDDNVSAATKKWSSVISLQSATTEANPTAGKTYALFACAGKISTPSFRLTTLGNGLPLANITLSLLYFIASSNVHSALLVGLLNGKIIGRSFEALMVSMTSLSNALCIVETPIRAVGLSFVIAVFKSFTCSYSCANGILCGCNSCNLDLTTNPFESMKKHLLFASSCDKPPLFSNALTTNSPIPTPASPAP
mmetsp:Transcript_9264/g.26785  ORF Transcript_9264/g.26785 Transcript_9264/m.26785 type:complete len:254 (+) Transcript_9264:989-1750(+)